MVQIWTILGADPMDESLKAQLQAAPVVGTGYGRD
jgi:hypothetical protein